MKFKNYLLRTLLFCVAVLTGGGELWADTTIYSWESPSGTVQESGGTASADDGVLNQQTSTIAGNFYVMKLANKIANIPTGAVIITLNSPLQEGDVIKVTGFQNKNDKNKVVSLYIGYYNGSKKKDEKKDGNNWVNLYNDAAFANASAPETKTYEVSSSGAGSNIIYLTRNSAGTNLWINKVVITRPSADTRAESSLAFTTATGTADINDGTSFTLPSLTKTPSNATVTFTGNNSAVADVDEQTGAVTLKKSGTVEITASFAGDDNYKPSSAKFTLTVEDSNDKTFLNAGGEANITNSGMATVTHKVWDFTNWSTATIDNLTADAATSASKGWSDIEKAANVNDPTKAVEGYFWSVANATVGGELTANGTVIEELKGLVFHNAYSTARSLSIINLSNMKCLWLGGSKKSCFTIKNVKVGSQLTMEVESHKTSEARGVQLYYNSVADNNKIGDAFTPTTKASNTWTVTGPSGAETVDVIVYNTNGCHIYKIVADVAEAKTVKLQMKKDIVVASGYTATLGNGSIALTFGETDGADFKAAKAATSGTGAIDGYVAYTEGNGENGDLPGGTFYIFEPKYAGTIEVGLVQNANTNFYIEEDGTALSDFNGITVAEKFYGKRTFNVQGGKTYKVYVSGSKMGFYGFEYKASVAANIAEFKTYDNGSEVLLTLTDAKVTAYKSAGIPYYVIEDASGAMPVIASDLGLAVGKVLNGTIMLKRNRTQGNGAESYASSNMSQVTMVDGTVEPTLVSDMSYFDQVENDFRYVKLESVTTNPKSSTVPGVTNYVVNKDGQTLYISNSYYSNSVNDIKGKNKLASIAGIFRRVNGFDPTKAEDIVAGEDQSLNEVTIAEFKQLAQEEKAIIAETASITFVNGDYRYIQNDQTDAIVVKSGEFLISNAGTTLKGMKLEAKLDKEGDNAPVADNTPDLQVSCTDSEGAFTAPRFGSAADVKNDNMIHAMVRLGRSKYVDGMLSAPAGTTNTIKVVDKFHKNINIPEDLAYITGIIGKENDEYVFYPVHRDSLKQYTNIVTDYLVGDIQDLDEEGKVVEAIPAGDERFVTGAVMTAAEDLTISEDAVTVSEGQAKEKTFTHKAEGDSFTFDATRKGTLTVYLEMQPKQRLSVTEDGAAIKALTNVAQTLDSLEIPVLAARQYVLTGTQTPLQLRGYTFRDANSDALDNAANIALFKSLYRDNIATEDTLQLKDAVVTYIKGDNVFVEDASGAIDFYRTRIQYYVGQKLNGYIVGKSGIISAETPLPALLRTDATKYGQFKAVNGQAPAPAVVTIGEMLQKKALARFVKAENVMMQYDRMGFKMLVDTITGESIHVTDKFQVFYELNDTVQSIEGIVGIDADGNHVLWPTSSEGVVSTKTFRPYVPEPEPQATETVVATLTLNGSAVADPEDFFAVEGSFNNKFNGASYEGVDYTSGLKLDSKGKVSFTTPEGVTATVTVVQSTWSDKTIKFDDGSLSVENAADGTGCKIHTFTVEGGEHSIGKGSGESGIFFVKVEYEMAVEEERAPETWDFQELCMKLGKGGPWAVNDGGDAGFTVGDATMHFLGDYTDEGFEWNNHIAYEYVADRGKFTMRNKNNKKDSNCGMFSWDYSHYVSLPDLKKGDKVTITIPTGTVTFVSDNVEGVAAGDQVVSNTAYTIKGDGTQRLDIQMAKATLIAKIVIEPAGSEIIPVIVIDKQMLALIPEATTKLKATSTPAAAKKQWKSANEAVATVDEDGTVTAVSAGTAKIICYWESDKSSKTSGDTCVVTVAAVDLSQYGIVKSYDFKSMEATTLEIGSEAAGKIWNAANNVNNNVFFCTNAGLEDIAIQAVMGSDNKGWTINENGFFLGTGAGRCAAVGNVKSGQIVEIIYTGDNFYTTSADDGIEKTALNEGKGRAIYQADADGMLGFELDKGNAIEKIVIYDLGTAISDRLARVYEPGAVYNLRGQKVEGTLKPGLYIKNGQKFVVK